MSAARAPSTAPPAGGVRGACPSVDQPMEAADGLLVRVRVPGGELTCAQAQALARVAGRDGSGVVELTSRANVQVRGVAAGSLAALRADLASAGLVPGDDRGDVVASPAAGLDPTEVADVRPLVRELLDRLASLAMPPRLHPKAAALIDGGGAVSLRGRYQDIALGVARRRDTGELVAELALGAPLPLEPDPTRPTWVVPLAAAPTVAAETLALTAPTHLDRGNGEERRVREVGERAASPAPSHPGGGESDGRRVRDVVGDRGVEAVVDEVARRAGVAIERVPAGLLERAEPRAGAPLGVHPSGRADGTVFVGAAPVLARVDADTLAGLAEATQRHGDGTLRLTPWRSVLVPGVEPARAPALRARLEALGLAIDPFDPATSVVACVGRAGCPAGLADTLADGRRLIADRRADEATPQARPTNPAPTVHVSGCAKRCASRQVHDVTLVAVAPDRYDVFVRDRASGGERLARTEVTAAEATEVMER